MASLSGKVALVTGGAQGLGKAFSEILLQNGAKVCILDVKEGQGKDTLANFIQKYGAGKASFYRCDVTCQQEMEDAFAFTKRTFGGLDLVCNNAGILDEYQWDRMIQINLIGVVRGTMLGIEHMSKEKGGQGGTIVNIASVAGLITNYNLPGYHAAKAGVVAFTRSWAKNPSCAKTGLQFHALCPEKADTEILHQLYTKAYDQENLNKRLKSQAVLSPEAVAQAFLQLVLCEGGSGQIMYVSTAGTRLIPEVDQLQQRL